MDAVADNCRLSIQHSVNGFSFSIIDHKNRQIKSLVPLCDEEHDFKSLLYLPFEKISLLIECSKYVLIPKEEFNGNTDLKQFPNDIFDISDTEEILTSFIENQDIVIIFAVPKSVLSSLRNRELSISINPTVAVPLQSHNLFDGSDKIFLRHTQNIAEITIIKNNTLRYCNSFHIRDFNSTLYFLIMATKESELDYCNTPLYISGIISDTDIEILTNYFELVKVFRNPNLPLGSKEIELLHSYMTFNI